MDDRFLSCDTRYDVAAFGSFGSGGRVDKVIYPREASAFAKARAALAKEGEYAIVGAATNVLFPDEGVHYPLLCTKKLRGMTFSDDGVYALAGESLAAVARICAEKGLSGLEPLSGIPGSAGGAAAMNAGAFGCETAELVEYIDAVTPFGELVRIYPHEAGFGYRKCKAVNDGLAVVGVKFLLANADGAEIKGSMLNYAERRRQSQPSGKSLGSVFARYDGVSAGYYIDRAGLKGQREGGAVISDKHANFIINEANATSADFVALSQTAKRKVRELFGINLCYEVRFL